MVLCRVPCSWGWCCDDPCEPHPTWQVLWFCHRVCSQPATQCLALACPNPSCPAMLGLCCASQRSQKQVYLNQCICAPASLVPGHDTGVLCPPCTMPPDTSLGSCWALACLPVGTAGVKSGWPQCHYFSTLVWCLYFWRAFTDAQLDLPKAQMFSVLNLCLPVGNSVWQAYLL